MKSIKLKNEGSPLVAQNEVRADIFSSSWAVFRNRTPTGEYWRVMVQNSAFSNWRNPPQTPLPPARRSDPFGPACLPASRQAGRQVGRSQVFRSAIFNYFMCPALINQFSDFISGIFIPLTKIQTPITNSKGA
jgi:hypothetical protein